MKKTLLFAFALSLGIANVATAQGDYSLTRDWKTNTTAKGADARQGCFANGKFYIQNRPAGQIEIWDQNGMVGTLPSTDKSTGICADDAGNILVTNVTEFEFGTESGTTRPVRIYPNGAAPATDIDLYLVCPPPASLSSDMRCDYFGHIEGNIMSEEGGEACWIVNRRKYLNILPIKNGAQDDDNSQAVLMDQNCFVNPVESFQTSGSAISSLTQSVAFKFNDEYCFDSRYIGLKGVEISTNDEGNLAAANKNDYTTAQSVWSYDPAYSCHVVGNTLFEMGGEKFIVAMIQYKTVDKERESSFAIVRASDQEKVAIWASKDHEAGIVAATAGANWITAVPVSENEAAIYQYFPAENAGEGWIAKYTFKNNGSSVEGVAEAKAKVIAGQGTIRIDGEAENIEVYNVAGTLISKGQTEVECAAGLYIVKVDGTVSKVLVK